MDKNIEELADFHFNRATDHYSEGRIKMALAEAEAALQVNPWHLESLTLAGEIHSLYPEELGLEPADSYEQAELYLGRALSRNPLCVEALSEKAALFLEMGRMGEALEVAEQGLFVLPLKLDFPMYEPSFFQNVAEELHKTRVIALWELGRKTEARQALAEAFEYCPGSSYLTDLLDGMDPIVSPSQEDDVKHDADESGC